MTETTSNDNNILMAKGTHTNFSSHFTAYYLNARSVNNKGNYLLLNTHLCDYDIIAITETWLSPDHHDREFMDAKYKTFRKDRAFSSIESEGGGGVLIAVKNQIDYEVFSTPEMDDLESICVKIPNGQNNQNNIFVYCVYIQPNASANTYANHTKAIASIKLNDDDTLLVFGDCNFSDTITWFEHGDSLGFVPLIGESQSMKAIVAKEVTSFFMDNGLFQMCNFENKSHNVLDLVLTNNPQYIVMEKADMLLIPEHKEDKAHTQMICTVDFNPLKHDDSGAAVPIYCFKKANFEEMRKYMDSLNISNLIESDNIDEMVHKLYELIYSVFDKYVPRITPRKSNRPVWYDDKILNLKNIRNKEYKKLCKERETNSDADPTKFHAARNDFDNYNKYLYDEYVKGIAADWKHNPKQLWSHINGKRKSNSLPCKMEFNGVSATTDKEKASAFAEFFSSVYVDYGVDDSLNEFINNRSEVNCLKLDASIDSLIVILKSMDLSKGMGPDFISPLFLRECAEQLAEPINKIFSKSLNECKFPEAWKIGYITPIYKSGSRSKVTNYRGVNIMSNLAKVFEKLIYNQLKLIIPPRISKSQHGFLSNRNIETNLMEFTTFIHDAFELKCQADVFYADIQKAFDTVNQDLLIRKLAKYPLSNDILRWFKSYFEGRKQCVRLGSTKSDCFSVTSGVGQGTILGPLLFLLFFNDSDDIATDSEMGIRNYNFADDKKKACIIQNRFDTEKLQSSIDSFIDWCDRNGLAVNTAKCKIITFAPPGHRKTIQADYFIKGNKIDRVDEMRDLGVIMDSKLSFNSHIEYTKKKSEMALAFVRRQCRNKLDKETMILLYNALVRSNLEFASSIWLPHSASQTTTIESVQKQAVIFIRGDYLNRSENNYVLLPYEIRCEMLGMTTLGRRRLNAAVIFIHKILSGRTISPTLRNELIINSGVRSLRRPEFIRLKNYRTDRALFSPFNIACRAFNFASLFIDPTLPLHQFRERLIKLPPSAFGDLLARR